MPFSLDEGLVKYVALEFDGILFTINKFPADSGDLKQITADFLCKNLRRSAINLR